MNQIQAWKNDDIFHIIDHIKVSRVSENYNDSSWGRTRKYDNVWAVLFSLFKAFWPILLDRTYRKQPRLSYTMGGR